MIFYCFTQSLSRLPNQFLLPHPIQYVSELLYVSMYSINEAIVNEAIYVFILAIAVYISVNMVE